MRNWPGPAHGGDLKRAGRPGRSGATGRLPTGPGVTAGENGRPVLRTGSMLAEAAAELAVIAPVHIAVTVEVEVPQVAGVAGARPGRGPEEVAVLSVHVAVAVCVPE